MCWNYARIEVTILNACGTYFISIQRENACVFNVALKQFTTGWYVICAMKPVYSKEYIGTEVHAPMHRYFKHNFTIIWLGNAVYGHHDLLKMGHLQIILIILFFAIKTQRNHVQLVEYLPCYFFDAWFKLWFAFQLFWLLKFKKNQLCWCINTLQWKNIFLFFYCNTYDMKVWNEYVITSHSFKAQMLFGGMNTIQSLLLV